MKKCLSVLLALLLLTSCSGAPVEDTPPPAPEPESQTESSPEPEPAPEGPAEPEEIAFSGLSVVEAGFATLDDAIAAYIEGVAAGDLYAALSACAITSYGYGYDIRARVDELQSYQMERDMGPSKFPLYGEANASIQLGNLAAQTKVFAECLTAGASTDIAPEAMESGAWLGDGTATGALDGYFTKMDPAGLSGLKVSEILIPSIVQESSEDTQAFFAFNSKLTGADESTQRIVVLALGDQIAVCSFQLLRYDGNWKIQSHGATLAGMLNTGVAAILTPEELESFKVEFVA